MFPAHIKYLDDGTKVVQSVKEHCEQTGKYAAQKLSSIGLSPVGEVSGLLHDMGKCTEKSRQYQENVASGKSVVKGSVIHTFQCCKYLLEKYNGCCDQFMKISAEVIAFAASAHHGLYDFFNEDHESGFEHRIMTECDYSEAKQNFFAECMDEASVIAKIENAKDCLTPVYHQFSEIQNNQEEAYFYLSCLARLIVSAVIDGDRQDTAEFLSDMTFPKFPEVMSPVWMDCLKHVEDKLNELPHSSPIQLARHEISRQCKTAAEIDDVLFRLNVPTGGGKTLGALRFALAHAAKHDKQRIVFVSPQLNILDQNAEDIKEYMGNNSLILEHHSDILANELSKEQEMLTENWNSPIIITTIVQFLNALFSGKTSCIRRFCSLSNSVIVIDEVQMIPNNMLTLFNLMVNFLTMFCKTTVVLCSATQPTLHTTRHHLYKKPVDIVPYDKALWNVFKRTQYVRNEDATIEGIPEIVLKRAAGFKSFLCICNKKGQAKYVYEKISEKHKNCFFYSAGMCNAHRKTVLKQIKAAISNKNEQVICIATQAMEAGIHISFESGMRLTAGYDNYIQAAGRCNRNGESETPAPFYNIVCVGESLKKLPEVEMSKKAMRILMSRYEKHSEEFDNQFDSEKAIQFYYRALYSSMSIDYQDYKLNGYPSVYKLLSENASYANDNKSFNKYCLKQAMKTAGDLFSVFGNKTKTVVVPYGDGASLIDELKEVKISAKYMFEWMQKIKPYTVSIYDEQLDNIQSSGGIEEIEGVLILHPKYYHTTFGVINVPI